MMSPLFPPSLLDRFDHRMLDGLDHLVTRCWSSDGPADGPFARYLVSPGDMAVVQVWLNGRSRGQWPPGASASRGRV